MKGGIIYLSEKLSLNAQKATTIPDLKSSLLVLLGQLAYDDCTILLSKRKLYAIKENDIVL